MVGSLVDAALAWMHIVSAIVWMGSIVFFTMALGPVIRSLSPQTRAEFSIKMIPKFANFVRLFAILTVVFGFALVLSLTGGNFSALAPTTPWGIGISGGMTLTIVALALGFGISIPTGHKIVKLIQEMQNNPQSNAMAQIPRLQKRLTMVAITVVVLQFCIVALMVIAARV
ncbi:MAG: hypothetical protein FJ358_04625 [Thaumarchaeota archaeon]|nr:hypothetical protein [Nitrososphaerota archaeon]